MFHSFCITFTSAFILALYGEIWTEVLDVQGEVKGLAAVIKYSPTFWMEADLKWR